MTATQQKKPWSTKDAMEQIYKNHLWGTNGSKFFSGQGSHDSNLVQPYIQAVTSFLDSFEEKIIVCDLGCGDFNVGEQLAPFTKSYIAVDIVEELIDYNHQVFNYPNVEFHCLDIAKDQLPKANCVVLRQVLQHLSNSEIQKIVEKLPAYKYVVLTEHIPKDEFVPNQDIISGQGIRLKKQSGVNLLAPPFNLKIKEEVQLLYLFSADSKGVIVTTLYML